MNPETKVRRDREEGIMNKIRMINPFACSLSLSLLATNIMAVGEAYDENVLR